MDLLLGFSGKDAIRPVFRHRERDVTRQDSSNAAHSVAGASRYLSAFLTDVGASLAEIDKRGEIHIVRASLLSETLRNTQDTRDNVEKGNAWRSNPHAQDCRDC